MYGQRADDHGRLRGHGRADIVGVSGAAHHGYELDLGVGFHQ